MFVKIIEVEQNSIIFHTVHHHIKINIYFNNLIHENFTIFISLSVHSSSNNMIILAEDILHEYVCPHDCHIFLLRIMLYFRYLINYCSTIRDYRYFSTLPLYKKMQNPIWNNFCVNNIYNNNIYLPIFYKISDLT